MTRELWIVADMDYGKQLFELARLSIPKISTRMIEFIDGSKEPQWTIEDEAGQRWHLVPTSRASHDKQLGMGRWLSPYSWVRG